MFVALPGDMPVTDAFKCETFSRNIEKIAQEDEDQSDDGSM
jgi:hypothetical protein